jgi:hypothetical protein
MNATTATITGFSLVVAERNDAGLVCQTLVTEAQPVSFLEADRALAAHSLGRTAPWDLGANGLVSAPVAPVDNRFNGTVAARLDQAMNRTHGQFEPVLATSVEDGDLITDEEMSAIYVVAGSRLEDGGMKIHMVGEMKTWADRYTTVFHGLVWVARKR